MKRHAFTLLELLLVLAIITMISALGVASFQRQYARATFKSGITEVQADMNRARTLAMRSSEAYIFRYAPGTGIYEIAPLRTLQEVVYRMNGEDDDEAGNGALGGSLALGTLASPVATNYEARAFSDDLFSPENIIADLREAGKLQEADARLGTTSVASTGGLGGSLAAPASALGYPQSTDAFSLGVSDPYGQGAEFPLDQKIAAGLATAREISVRELNSDERQIAKTDNVLALRVNARGLVVRKEANGGVIFTYARLSDSTPTNLKTKRPKAADVSTSTSPAQTADEGNAALGAGLGGSLTAPPSNSTLFGVGTNSATATNFGDPFAADASGATFSIWSEPIVFYPNGRTSTVVVGLANVGRYEYYSEIAIRGMTGYARVSGVSAAPPGSDVGHTVLTREQIYRLQNPNEYATALSGQTTPDALGGGLGGDATDGANLAGQTFDSGQASTAGLGGLDAGLGSGLGAESGGADLLGQDSAGFASQYGRTEGRSGYRFNTGGSNQNAGLGAGVNAGLDAGTGAGGNAGLGQDLNQGLNQGLSQGLSQGAGLAAGTNNEVGMGGAGLATGLTPQRNASSDGGLGGLGGLDAGAGIGAGSGATNQGGGAAARNGGNRQGAFGQNAGASGNGNARQNDAGQDENERNANDGARRQGGAGR